jgi:hypothetical protein
MVKKIQRLIAISFVITIGFIVIGVASRVSASQYIGEACWELEEDGAIWGIIKLGFSNTGDGHFIMSGTLIDYDGYEVDIVHGNAEIQGGNILMTIVGSGRDAGTLWTWTDNVILNTSTLNGSYEGIVNERNYSDGSISTQFEEGRFIYTTCE